MPEPIFRVPATDSQLARLRQLASDYGLPPDAKTYVEGKIAGGLSKDEAYDLIGKLGARIDERRRTQSARNGR